MVFILVLLLILYTQKLMVLLTYYFRLINIKKNTLPYPTLKIFNFQQDNKYTENINPLVPEFF
jgi:hypothetical protein